MSLLSDLGIEVTEQGKHKVILEMELTEEHLQMEANKKGSVNAMLSETAASIGANLNMEKENSAVVTSMSLHSLNDLKLGNLVAEAISVRNGNNIQTWQVTTHLKKSAIPNSLSTVILKRHKFNYDRF